MEIFYLHVPGICIKAELRPVLGKLRLQCSSRARHISLRGEGSGVHRDRTESSGTAYWLG